MRKIPKYKLFYLSKKNIFSYPKKVLNFKHSKWLFVKTLNKKIKQKNFLNFFKLSKKLKIVDKKKKIFKTNLIYMRNIKHSLDNSFKPKAKKNKKKNLKTIFKDILLNYEYSINILLYRLKVFNNIFEAKNYIKSKGIFINNKKVFYNALLKKGDIIKFDELFYKLKANIFTNKEYEYLLPFVEVDFYVSQLVIIKDLEELSESDLLLFFKVYYNISQLYNLNFKKQ